MSRLGNNTNVRQNFRPKVRPTSSREEMRRFVKEGKYRIEFPTDSNLAVEFETFNEILPVLGRRNWSLFLAPKHGSDFNML